MSIGKGGGQMYYPYMQQMSSQQRRVMTVTGVGNILVEPNIVQLQLDVITENEKLKRKRLLRR